MGQSQAAPKARRRRVLMRRFPSMRWTPTTLQRRLKRPSVARLLTTDDLVIFVAQEFADGDNPVIHSFDITGS